MQERGKEGEQDFWDGHSFGDNCERVSGSGKVWTVDTRVESKSLKELKEATRHRKLVPIKTFDKKGQIFSLKEFPLGTIVGLSKDTHFKINVLDFRYKAIALFGIVSEQDIGGQSQDVLFCFSTQDVERSGPALAHIAYARDIEVGKVDHDRYSFMRIKYLESLGRVNRIEVLQYGNRLRERQPVPRTSFSFSPDTLSPERVYSRA